MPFRRIVATSDTHYPFPEHMIPEGDWLFHAGDLMYEGTPAEYAPRKRSLADLKPRFRHIIYVPGNHDYHVYHYEGAVAREMRAAGIRVLRPAYPRTEIDGVKILGIPFVTNLPGWAYNVDETWLYDWLCAATENFEPDIVISHAPMHGTMDIVNPENKDFDFLHVGSHALRKWGESPGRRVKHWINGHIHESYGVGYSGDMPGCTFYNACMCDRNYVQNNKPHVFDIEVA